MSQENLQKNRNEQVATLGLDEQAPNTSLESEKNKQEFAEETIRKIENDWNLISSNKEEVEKIENTTPLNNPFTKNEIKSELDLDNKLKTLDNENKRAFSEARTKIMDILKKVVIIGAIPFVMTGKVEAQKPDTTKANDKIFSPEKTWVFEEGTDSVMATNKSKTYSGFVENYMRNENGKYSLYQYSNENGDIMDPPEDIQKSINENQLDIDKYSDPDWPQKQFEYQQTNEFKEEVVQKYITGMQKSVNDIKDKFELLKDSQDYSEEDRKKDREDMDKYQKSIDYTKKDPSWIIKEKTENLEQLKQDARGYVYLAQQEMKKLQEKLKSTLDYIESHKEK